MKDILLLRILYLNLGVGYVLAKIAIRRSLNTCQVVAREIKIKRKVRRRVLRLLKRNKEKSKIEFTLPPVLSV